VQVSECPLLNSLLQADRDQEGDQLVDWKADLPHHGSATGVNLFLTAILYEVHRFE
jgi:hypothetical protein